VTDFELEDRVSNAGRDRIFLFATMSRPAVEPTHPPVQSEPTGGPLPRNKAGGV